LYWASRFSVFLILIPDACVGPDVIMTSMHHLLLSPTDLPVAMIRLYSFVKAIPMEICHVMRSAASGKHAKKHDGHHDQSNSQHHIKPPLMDLM
jgi:hypothetical protein